MTIIIILLIPVFLNTMLSDLSVFSLGKKCICPSYGFDNSKNKLESSYCTYMCNDTTLLSTECGGESAFNVFLTG